MNQYDFSGLSDKEFESLSIDLISAHYGVQFERFKDGKDQGIDGRFQSSGKGKWILQCKHWKKTSLSQLVKSLGKTESPKVTKLAPDRYILTVSKELSAGNKSAISEALGPHIKNQDDIHGIESLNDILSKHPEIERRHYKLWITSTNTLSHFLNKPILDRSEFKIEEILSRAKLYAMTSNHEKARQHLELKRALVITGEAGIGKTTLAEHLALECIANGFEFIHIAEKIGEAESVFEKEKKQVFYFDDFLGSNYTAAISGHEGSHISEFMLRVSRDPKKRFILTSRTNILNQGRIHVKDLTSSSFVRSEFELTLNTLDLMDKARILYNHIWHSDLDDSYIDEIYKDHRYRKIITHRNFNPRLIEFITDSYNSSELAPTQFWDHINDTLTNPSQVWRHPFEAQHDDFGRAAILLVTLNGKSSQESAIASAYNVFASSARNANLQGVRDFSINLRHLCKSMLNRTAHESSSTQLSLFNPSIGDYVLHRYAKDIPTLECAAASLASRTAIDTLISMQVHGTIASSELRSIAASVLDDRMRPLGDYSKSFIVAACLAYRRTNPPMQNPDPRVVAALRHALALSDVCEAKSEVKAVEWALELGAIGEMDAVRIIQTMAERADSEDLTRIAGIIKTMTNEAQTAIIPTISTAGIHYLIDEVRNEISSSQVFDNVDPGNLDVAEQTARNLIEEKLRSFGAAYSEDDVDEILNWYNVEDRMSDHFYNWPEDDSNEGTQSNIGMAEVDDLFERGD
jgi:cytidylate kinase